MLYHTRRIVLEAFKRDFAAIGLYPSPEAIDFFKDALDKSIEELHLEDREERGESGPSPEEIAATLANHTRGKYDEKILALDRPVLYVTRIRLKPSSIQKVKIAYFGTDFHTAGYYNSIDSMAVLKPEKVDEVAMFFNDSVETAAKAGAKIICFPELTCPVERLDQISKLARQYGVYVITGSYHELKSHRNVSVILTPNEKYEQYKLEKSKYEGTEPKNTAIVNVFDTENGRFVVLICYDVEHPAITRTLTEEMITGFGVDIIFNPSSHPDPPRARNHLLTLANKLTAAAVFANNQSKGGSFGYSGDRSVYELASVGMATMDIDLKLLRELRPPSRMATPGKI